MNAQRVFRQVAVFVAAAAFAGLSLGLLAQATPPGRVNYQGVLRDASGNPLSGSQTMLFRFYDAASGGTVLWEETYSASYPPQVTVSTGLFTVALGDATHRTNGSEPLFPNVFANHAAVYLAVAVGLDAEMTPRIQAVSAPFAENTASLQGRQPASFADATHAHAASDITSGTLAIARGGTGLSSPGASGNILTSSGSAWTSAAPTGAATWGAITGTLSGQADLQTALNNKEPVIAAGSTAQYWRGDKSWQALNATAVGLGNVTNNAQITGAADASLTQTGSTLGLNVNHPNTWAGGQAFNGGLSGALTGNVTGTASGNIPMVTPGASGNILTSSGSAWTSAAPPSAGTLGAVVDTANTTLTRSGSGTGADPYKLALNLGNANTWSGAQTFGTDTYFPGSGIWNASGNVGIGAAPGSTVRLYVQSTASGKASLASGDVGIAAFGNTEGGFFQDTDGSGFAYVGDGDYGIDAYANGAGGYFADLDSSGYACVGYDTYKILGGGAVSFVQNHPVQKDKVIVYACPEGDEVATYTRGTAKLVNGEARVQLGETFKWVTNPDIGLTAHLTPVGDWSDLYVAKKSTTELVVRSHGGAQDAAFDYIVYGLRIGFEESSIVQEKQQESYIPSFNNHRERYAKYPELRAFNALERFKTMDSSVRGVPESSIDLSRAKALHDAIHEYDPATDPPVDKLFGFGHGAKPNDAAPASGRPALPSSTATGPSGNGGILAPAASSGPAAGAIPVLPVDADGNVYGKSFRPASADFAASFPVCGPVEAGDVLVTDANHPGAFCRSLVPNDPGVVGVVAGEPGVLLGSGPKGSEPAMLSAPVATSGIVKAKVDAGYGPIALNDLLVVSPTPGHAMKAQPVLVGGAEVYKSGTIIGKALESLESGTGTIKVLVMLR